MAQATPPTETFGDFLKMVRLYCGLESQQLAAHARVSNATITYYEQGRGTPNPRNLERLTRSLQQRLNAKLAAQGQEPVDLWPYTLHLWLVHGGANPTPTPERPPLPRQEQLPSAERAAIALVHDYWGDVPQKCTVIGETSSHYRVRWEEDVPGSKLKKGDTSLLPKVAVEFTEEQ